MHFNANILLIRLNYCHLSARYEGNDFQVKINPNKFPANGCLCCIFVLLDKFCARWMISQTWLRFFQRTKFKPNAKFNTYLKYMQRNPNKTHFLNNCNSNLKHLKRLTCSSRVDLLSSHVRSNHLSACPELNPSSVSLHPMQELLVVAVAFSTCRSCDTHDQRSYVDLIAATWLIYGCHRWFY